MIEELLVITSALISLDVFYTAYIILCLVIYNKTKPEKTVWEYLFLNRDMSDQIEWKFSSFIVLIFNLIYIFCWSVYLIYNLIF